MYTDVFMMYILHKSRLLSIKRFGKNPQHVARVSGYLAVRALNVFNNFASLEIISKIWYYDWFYKNLKSHLVTNNG